MSKKLLREGALAGPTSAITKEIYTVELPTVSTLAETIYSVLLRSIVSNLSALN